MPTNSEVPRIELNPDGTVAFFVRAGGFDPDTLVEVSGYANQANGTTATFRAIRKISAKGEILVIRGVPVIGASGFTPDHPIMVVAQAAEIWITKLDLETNGNSLSQEIMQAKQVSGQLNSRQAWNSDDKTYHSVFGTASPPTGSTPTTTLVRRDQRRDRVEPDPLDVVMEGRYTKLFPDLPCAKFDQADLKLLARAMTAPPEEPGHEAEDDPEENPGVPAAYTYLGQFVDHDLTFDATSRLRGPPTELQTLVDLRTPRFDLDNLYGRGPVDQPYLYEKDGVRMLLGEPMPDNPFDPGAVQLPRGPSGRALIGDPRNDENRIVAQLHAIFLRFHNEVVDRLGGKKNVSFQEVRQFVRWHYQWILVKDFLPKILQQQMYESVFPDPYHPRTTIPRLQGNEFALMPVEFSVAAYRFGHSMIRPRYRLNPSIVRPIFSSARGDTADLGGFRPIPANWAIDWQFFIDLGHDAGPATGVRRLARPRVTRSCLTRSIPLW